MRLKVNLETSKFWDQCLQQKYQVTAVMLIMQSLDRTNLHEYVTHSTECHSLKSLRQEKSKMPNRNVNPDPFKEIEPFIQDLKHVIDRRHGHCKYKMTVVKMTKNCN